MEKNMCTPTCPHLRSFRYGFDGVRIVAPYHRDDALATCAQNTELTIHLRSLPSCCWGTRLK